MIFSLPNLLQKLLQSHSSLAFGKRLLRMLTAGLTSTFKNTTAILKWGCYTLQVAFPASSSESTKHRMQGTCTWWGNNTSSFHYFVMRPPHEDAFHGHQDTHRMYIGQPEPKFRKNHLAASQNWQIVHEVVSLRMVITTPESLQDLYMYALAIYLSNLSKPTTPPRPKQYNKEIEWIPKSWRHHLYFG